MLMSWRHMVRPNCASVRWRFVPLSGCSGNCIESCIHKAQSVHTNWVMIQSMDWGWLWLTLHPMTDLATTQTPSVEGSSTPPSLSPGKAQEADICQRHERTLFVPMATSSRVKQLVRARHPSTWMESCLIFFFFFFFNWQTHKSPAVLSLFIILVFLFHRRALSQHTLVFAEKRTLHQSDLTSNLTQRF